MLELIFLFLIFIFSVGFLVFIFWFYFTYPPPPGEPSACSRCRRKRPSVGSLPAQPAARWPPTCQRPDAPTLDGRTPVEPRASASPTSSSRARSSRCSSKPALRGGGT